MKKISFIFVLLILIIVGLTKVQPLSAALYAAPNRPATPSGETVKPKVLVAKLSGLLTKINANNIVVGTTTVNISTTTRLLRKYSAVSKLSEFTVGDQINVIGAWTDTNKTAINARVVRDVSIQKRRGVFVGVVSSLSTTGFTLTPEKRTMQTVTINSLTKFVERGEITIPFSVIKNGDKVMVKGLWDNKLNTITEVTFVRDYSLPIKAPKTATNSGEAR